jgi:dihydrofolate synthase / folylpolyglutamate synthase
MKSTHVLITGFQAFGRHPVNSSEIVARAFSRYSSGSLQYTTVILPVTWRGCADLCTALGKNKRFNAILMTGMNDRIRHVALEQRAINLQRSNIPDNTGLFRSGTPVISDGPEMLETNLDVPAMALELTRATHPVRPSLDAGTFVCNTLYYRMLHKQLPLTIPVLFVHLPEINSLWTVDTLAKTLQSIGRLMLAKKRFHTTQKTGIDTMQKAETFLYSFINYERKTGIAYSETNYNLDRFQKFLAKQDHPQQRGRSVHVAGTKGKGCVSAIIASVFSANGYKTGLYTSPHLVNVRERIRLDGQAVPETDFIRLAAYQAAQVKKTDLPSRSFRTTFELLTAMAFQYFAGHNTDWDVFETGMGGRLDCTNVVFPEVCAITRIDMDHTDSLGNTLLAIAGEKAGIIKPGRPVVLGRQAPVVARFLKAYARNSQSRCVFALSDIPVKNVVFDHQGTSFSTKFLGRWRHGFRINLPGAFQLDNCRHALAVLQELASSNRVRLETEAIKDGLARIQWPGRFYVIDGTHFAPALENVTIIVDGAHNRYAVKTLFESVRKLYPENPVTVIFGCARNKDARSMMEVISTYAARMIVTTYDNPRARSPGDLEQIAACSGVRVTGEPDVKNAVYNLKRCIMKHEIVVVTGSLYLVGECLEKAGLTHCCLDIYQAIRGLWEYER